MEILKQSLGPTYGGPSISFEEGEFVLYDWTDAPVGMTVLARSPTWDGFIALLKEARKQKHGPG